MATILFEATHGYYNTNTQDTQTQTSPCPNNTRRFPCRNLIRLAARFSEDVPRVLPNTRRLKAQSGHCPIGADGNARREHNIHQRPRCVQMRIV